MKINSVKKVGDKYLINNKILVPLDQGNKFYSILKDWLDKNNDIQLAAEPASTVGMSDIDIDYTAKKNKIINTLKNKGGADRNLWDIQHLEAILHLYVKEAPTPFLDGLAEARGETKRVVAKKILTHSSDYMYKLGKATGQMQMQKQALGDK